MAKIKVEIEVNVPNGTLPAPQKNNQKCQVYHTLPM